MPHSTIFSRFRADHRRVLAELARVERRLPASRSGRGAVAPRARRAWAESLRPTLDRLARQFDTHMAAEDDHLFPALLAAIPETRDSLVPLRDEHAELRAMLANLDVVLKQPGTPARDEQLLVQWRDFSELLRIHIRKEEAGVFNIAEHALPADALSRIESRRFPGRAKGRGPAGRLSSKGASFMRRMGILVIALGIVLALHACGGKPAATESGSGTATPAASTTALAGGGTSSSGGGLAAVSRYDSGPRAGESVRNEAMAKVGEGLFKTKGCSACHAFGRKLTCPDLQGVSMRRTALWMENQILHPDVMVKQDPISHALFAKFALQMPNQGLTPDEVKQVIEYFKHMDHETGESKAESH
jgi:mono/diheme cytochrome c family protein